MRECVCVRVREREKEREKERKREMSKDKVSPFVIDSDFNYRISSRLRK